MSAKQEFKSQRAHHSALKLLHPFRIMADVALKEIIRCKNTRKWLQTMDKLEYPYVVPQTNTIVDYERSLYRELDIIPAVARLSHVKQLGLASHTAIGIPAEHTRYLHSLVFATQIDYIAQTLGLDRKLAVTAAMLHDIASPPFSDSVANALGTSDEYLFESVLNSSPEALEYLRKHKINKQNVVNLVRGKDNSPLGQLVNSQNSIDVDRWSYVALDACKLGQLPFTWTDRYMPDPFESASIVNGRVVFGNSHVVGEFLEARTKMYEKFYRNPGLMAKEAFVGRVAKELHKRGFVSMENLFQMVDTEFEWLAKKTGELAERIFGMDGFHSYGTVKAEPEVVVRELERLTKRPFEVKKHKLSNPAIETPILEGRKVAPYRYLEPQHSADLTMRMDKWNRTFVYGIDDDSELVSAVREVQSRLGGGEFNGAVSLLPA